jgi:hypothetical protein
VSRPNRSDSHSKPRLKAAKNPPTNRTSRERCWLAEELARDTGDEGGRDEHRAERECDGDQRAADLVHGPPRGLRRRITKAQVALDILDDDDGVIDHDTDGEHQSEQRQVVEREAKGGQDGEDADQRHRDGGDRNDRGAPSLQEQNDDQQHQQDRYDDGYDHFMH